MDSTTLLSSTWQWIGEEWVQETEMEAYGTDLTCIPSASQWPATLFDLTPVVEETAQTDNPFSSDDYLENPPKRPRLEDGTYQCDLCNISYTEQRSLLRHQRTPAHSQKSGQPARFYPCQHCKKQFTRVDLWQRHENEVHCGFKRRRTQRVVRRSGSLKQDTERNRTITSRPIAGNGWTRQSDNEEFVATASGVYHWSGDAVSDETPPSALLVTSSEIPLRIDADDSPPNPCSTITATDLIQEGPPDEPLVSPTILQGLQRTQSLRSTHAASDQGESASVRSFPASTWSISMPLRGAPSLTRRVSSLRRAGANLRPHSVKPPPPCPMCRATIGTTVIEMREHFGWHFAEMRGTHVCHWCEINFVHKQDLVAHQKSAQEGHCGFQFPHNQLCRGHHPPEEGGFIYPDHNRMELRCLTWEAAQIDAFWVYLHEVSQMGIFRTEHQSWSVNEFWNQSRSSLKSAFSWLSAPSHVDFHAKVNTSDIKAARFHPTQAETSLTNDQSGLNNRNFTFKLGGRRSINTRLVQAIRNGACHDVQSLILQGARVNATVGPIEYEDGELVERTRPLVVAARRGDTPMLELLLREGANVANSVGVFQREVTQTIADSNMTNMKVTTSILRHRIQAYIFAFGLLIKAGAQLDDDWRSMLLGLAVDIEALESVKMLLSLGVRATCPVIPLHRGHNSVETHRMTVLSLAVERDNLRILALLYEHCSEDAGKALLAALTMERVDIAIYLLRLNTLYPLPLTPAQRRVLNLVLSVAVQRTEYKAVSFLLDAPEGASVHARRAEDREALLIVALEVGSSAVANILVSHGADRNPRRSTEGESALMLALQLGSARLVDRLALVADVRSPDRSGQTPLDRAVQLGRRDFVRILLLYGADPDIHSPDMEHPLIEAAKKDAVEIVRALIKHHEERLGSLRPRSARAESASLLYASAVNAAVTHDSLVVLDEILWSQCSANLSIEDRASALIYAAENDMPDIIEILLSHSSRIATRDPVLEPALTAVIRKQSLKAFDLLVR